VIKEAIKRLLGYHREYPARAYGIVVPPDGTPVVGRLVLEVRAQTIDELERYEDVDVGAYLLACLPEGDRA